MDRINAAVHGNGRADTDAGAGVPLHTPGAARIAASQLTAFTRTLEAECGRTFADHAALERFAIDDFRAFWRHFLQSSQLLWDGSPAPVCIGDACEQAVFFPALRLNYAENLLHSHGLDDTQPALTAYHTRGDVTRLTRGELRAQVTRFAQALQRLGLREGDRVVAVMRNDENAVIAALAVAALGATLSTAAPEMGKDALISRFEPLTPRLLLAHTMSQPFDTGASVASTIAGVAAALPTLQAIVSLSGGSLPSRVVPPLHELSQLMGDTDPEPFVWHRRPFNHPLFILFSSGTTGRPKCIVHGAGGTLLEHVKEQRLHCDLRPGDKMYFHTSCAWMMWNWQLSALASGVEIVLYDGPIANADTLWRMVAAERVTAFGTSPAYLKMCQDAELEPGRDFDLGALQAIMSTGAILYDSQFEWVHGHVKDVPLQSISGGTDIIGCFVLGNPNLPVFSGTAQCRSLGLDVKAWKDGEPSRGIGELICANPFPSRPLGFFGDTDGSAFHRAYFSANAGVWTHGDLIEFTAEGSARMHGRCDGVLNVRGINVGPADIYRVLQTLPEIREAMVVEQRLLDRAAQATGSRVVLLLVTHDGNLSGALATKIRRELARRASPAHVPDVIVGVQALPLTHNGKYSEAAARDAVNGLPAANVGALRNAECLDVLRSHPALRASMPDLPELVAPSLTDLERHLQTLWEALFGFGPIAYDDDFFELGGHSLLGARMLTEVKRLTGRSIPLATLLLSPTIERLAQHIRGEAAPRLAASSILVPMRGGTGQPVFFMHSVTGTVMECWELAAALKTLRPVYGLQARGLDGESMPCRDLQTMARDYIEQMRALQPQGPYALAGYSFGGLVAFEVAQQLGAAGEKVELLAVLDTYVNPGCLSWPDWLRCQISFWGYQIGKLRRQSLRQLVPYLLNRVGATLDRLRMRSGNLAHRPEAVAAGLPPHLREVRESMRVAMARYRPQSYAFGPVLYFRAAFQRADCQDPLPVWRRVSQAGLEIQAVDGDHIDMLVEPYVEEVAHALDDRL